MKLFPSTRFSGVRLTLLPALLAFCLAAFCNQAQAGCGLIAGAKVPAVKLPIIQAEENQPWFDNKSIVGLWKASYTQSNGEPFIESFKSWHADGLEFESAFLNPAGGNVCTGVWKVLEFRTVKLHHIGWFYLSPTPGAPATNYFTVDESDTVAPDGKTYTGEFTFKLWNLDGTPGALPGQTAQYEVKGTIAATRITV